MVQHISSRQKAYLVGSKHASFPLTKFQLFCLGIDWFQGKLQGCIFFIYRRNGRQYPRI